MPNHTTELKHLWGELSRKIHQLDKLINTGKSITSVTDRIVALELADEITTTVQTIDTLHAQTLNKPPRTHRKTKTNTTMAPTRQFEQLTLDDQKQVLIHHLKSLYNGPPTTNLVNFLRQLETVADTYTTLCGPTTPGVVLDEILQTARTHPNWVEFLK